MLAVASDKSGRQDLNLRPVAAATALAAQPVQLIATSACLEIPLARDCLAARGVRLGVNQCPRHSVASRLGFTAVVASKAIIEIRARADVSAAGDGTAKDV